MPKDLPPAYDQQQADNEWEERRQAGALTAAEQNRENQQLIRDAYSQDPPAKPGRKPAPKTASAAASANRQLIRDGHGKEHA